MQWVIVLVQQLCKHCWGFVDATAKGSLKEDDGVTEVYSNIVASEKGSKGKSSMLKICTKIALEGRCLLQNLVNWLYMLWSIYERVQVQEQSGDRKYVFWWRANRAMGKRNLQAGYVFRVLTWNFLLMCLLLATQGKRKCSFFGAVTFNQHVTWGNRWVKQNVCVPLFEAQMSP